MNILTGKSIDDIRGQLEKLIKTHLDAGDLILGVNIIPTKIDLAGNVTDYSGILFWARRT